MGSSTDVMQTYISREIAGVYAGSAGWNIAQSNPLTGYNKVIVLEKVENGTKETVFLGVTFDRAVPEDLLNVMKQTKLASSVYQSKPPRREILVPKNADTSAVPKDFNIRPMNSFGFDGEALIWYKKPVQVTNTPKAS
jgi:hypothetical protein